MAIRRTVAVEADAEKYGFDRVEKLFIRPPEGIPLISKNLLIVGQRGVGKTMLLKYLYLGNRGSREVLPVYLELERWTSRIAAEAVRSLGLRTPREIELRACAHLGLSSALIKDVESAYGQDVIKRCQSVFPGQIQTYFQHSDWQDRLLELIRQVCAGQRLGVPPAHVPTVAEVANRLGDMVREMGKTLLILVDQADKVPAVVAEEIARLLDKGGSYVCVLATRPYPTAPDVWTMPSRIMAGDDYDIFTLGRYPRSEPWEDFLLQALAQHTSVAAMTELVSRADNLVCFSAGSVRTALQIAQRLEQGLSDEKQPNAAWASAVEMTADQEVTLARNAISAYCGSIPTFLKSLQSLAFSAMQESGASLAPVVMRIEPGAEGQGNLFGLHENAQFLLRASSKAGLFAPTAANPWIPDMILDEYQVSPLLLVAEEHLSGRVFDRQEVYFSVNAADLARWASSPGFPRTRRSRKARVFVSYWMSRFDKDSQFHQVLDEAVGAEVDILVGRAQGSSPWIPAILENMKKSDAVVVDLTVPRRDVYVELGLATGLEKPTLLVTRGDEERGTAPSWLQHRQILSFDSPDRLATVFNEIRRLASGIYSRSEKWLEDQAGEPLKYSPNHEVVGVIGGPAFLDSQWHQRSAAEVAENNFESRQLNPEDDSNPNVLYDCIRIGREASTLVVHFTGSNSDYAACVAGGTSVSHPRVNVQNLHFSRQIIAVIGDNADPGVVPGMIRQFAGTRIVTHSGVGAAMRKRMQEAHDFRGRLHKALNANE